MSLFNTMRTATSGMAAQSSALSTIGDNIANSSTTGYKDASTQFETVLGINATSEYESGSVQTDVRYGIANQGSLTATSSATDLAVNGSGFFVVSQGGQGSYLTRAGSFVADSQGNLVNSAGYTLMGYAMVNGKESQTLTPINVNSTTLQYSASSTGSLTANFPSTATDVTGDKPSQNASDSTYSEKMSLTTYDKEGNAVVLDVYATKTGTDSSGNSSWEVTAFNSADASSTGGFPYSSGALATETMTFNSAGALQSTTTGSGTSATTSTSNLNFAIPVPNGNTVSVSLNSVTQAGNSFSYTATADGNAPGLLSSVKIGTDGTLTGVYGSGSSPSSVVLYKIPLATVTSPDNLTSLSGNVYQASSTSGAMTVAAAGSSGLGQIESGELESSTVDLATELTNMIQAQRAYEANSKVLQAGSDLLSVLNRLSSG